MRDKGAVKIMKFQPVFSSATLPNTIDFLQKSGKGEGERGKKKPLTFTL